ncbi:hypothetical protein ACQKGC_28745 [Allorhizobium pseudoryzae]|uniref:hypothetical protein n=1 Tax=Allorhizobium pseudoryzae TaxID=379684 RepID=UPI003D042A40
MLFAESVASLRDHTVIDFGSGLHQSQHLPIEAAAICRIDSSGVVASDFAPIGSNLYEVLELIDVRQKTAVLAFRVFSVLDPDYLAHLLDLLSVRVQNVVICDYFYNPQRSSEYVEIQTVLGPTATVTADWAIGQFYHYKPRQIADRLKMRVIEALNVTVPSVNNDVDYGMLLKFRAYSHD